MKTPLLFLLSLTLLTGCETPPKEQGFTSSGFFTPKGDTNTVFWNTSTSSAHAEIRFVVFWPATEVQGGGQGLGYFRYYYWQMKSMPDGHQCLLESVRDFKAGSHSLRFSDFTAKSVVNLSLGQSRYWRYSESGVFVPLDQVDPAISERIVQESETGTKRLLSVGQTP
jgi:hypothetical protein